MIIVIIKLIISTMFEVTGFQLKHSTNKFRISISLAGQTVSKSPT